MKEKVLIVGIDSFTGKFLKEILEKKSYSVYGTSLSKNSSDRVQTIDLSSIESLLVWIKKVQPSYVFHLAAVSHVQSNPMDLYRVNVIGSENLLIALRDSGLKFKKIILASSAIVYGDVSGSIDESVNPCPINHYGISKYAMELISRKFFDYLPILILRPFNYTGEGQSDQFVIPKLISAFARKEPSIALGNIDTLREYNDVKDVVNGYLNFMTSPFVSDFFNLGSGRTYSLREIIKILSELTNHEPEIVQDPRFMRPNEIIELKSDSKKLLDSLAKTPFETSIEQTFSRMLSIYST